MKSITHAKSISNFFFIPENLNMKILLINSGNVKMLKHIDKFHYFISRICWHIIFNRKYFREHESEFSEHSDSAPLTSDKSNFVRLKSKYLERVLSRRQYYKIKKLLIELNVVECNESYHPGDFSKGYRLTEKYRFTRLKRVDVSDQKFNQRLNKIKLETFRLTPQDESLFDYLYGMDILYQEAIDFIDKKNANGEYSNPQYNARLWSIEIMKEKDHYYITDSKSGRVFTVFCNIASDIRGFVRYHGKILCEIDIANSQPFFLNMVILEYLKTKNGKNIEKRFSDVYGVSEMYNRYFVQTNSQKSIIFPPYVRPFFKLPDDVTIYRTLTSSGQFYEYIQKIWSEKLGKFIERDECKTKTLTLIYGKPHWTYKEKDVFINHLPTVWEVIEYEKRKDFRDLPIKLQKVEADFILHTVIKRLIMEGKVEYLATRHDSIVTLPEHEGYVSNVIREESRKMLGIEPTLKSKIVNNE